jgi:hypothetical protein
MVVTPDDMLAAAAICRPALDAIADEDWSTPVRDLEWDVRKVLTHASDAIGWYAAQLAATGTPRLRVDFRVHDRASQSEVLDVLDAAASTLAYVARAVPSTTRAYHEAGVADASGSLAMGCDELLVHCWDAVTTFGGSFSAPADLAERVTRRLFPWVREATDWWRTLLWANGRVDLPGEAERLGPDWAWHCAPLDEWDGTIPRWEG